MGIRMIFGIAERVMSTNPGSNPPPKITFSIVTYNEQARIRRCLDAILAQKYPRDRMEILVMDGGSTDRTQEIARELGATVHFNREKLPEPGLALAYELVQGDYMVYMAADNILFDPDWTSKIMCPIQDDPEHVVASFSRAVNDPADNIWNKYVNEDVEPFSAFTFWNASHPDKFRKIYEVDKETEDYVIYRYTVEQFPLIALAQCTVLKTGLKRNEASRFDDILPLVDLIREGKKIAYVKTTGIYHYSFSGFGNYCRKFRNRIYNSIKTHSYNARALYNSPAMNLRKYLFIPYSFSIVLPFLHGVILAVEKRKWYMLIHPVACLVLAYYILHNAVKIHLLRR